MITDFEFVNYFVTASFDVLPVCHKSTARTAACGQTNNIYAWNPSLDRLRSGHTFHRERSDALCFVGS